MLLSFLLFAVPCSTVWTVATAPEYNLEDNACPGDFSLTPLDTATFGQWTIATDSSPNREPASTRSNGDAHSNIGSPSATGTNILTNNTDDATLPVTTSSLSNSGKGPLTPSGVSFYWNGTTVSAYASHPNPPPTGAGGAIPGCWRRLG